MRKPSNKTFTNTIKLINSNFITLKSTSIVIKNEYLSSLGYKNFGYVWNGGACNYSILTFNVNLLSDVKNYSKVVGKFYVDGGADDYFIYYLNGNKIGNSRIMICSGGESCLYTSREENSLSFNVTQNNNTLSINLYSSEGDYGAIIWSAYIKITSYSK